MENKSINEKCSESNGQIKLFEANILLTKILPPAIIKSLLAMAKIQFF